MAKKILIVDDELPFLLSLKDGLRKYEADFQVLVVENGSKAVEILRSTTIDLLVTDLKMPEMNGFELLAWISRHKPQLPVIVMSAFGTPEIEARLNQFDTLQFLEKPLDLTMLKDAILNGLNAGGKSFIRGISLATFLQLMKVEQKNCTLKITADGISAFLYISRGELIDAEMGDKSGLPAALEIVSWDNAEIEMDGICRRYKDVIQTSMEHLLMEAFQQKDEATELQKSDGTEFVATNEAASVSDHSSECNAAPQPLHKRLAVALSRLAVVREFIVFNQNNSPQSRSRSAASLSTISPVEFEVILNQIPEEMALGDFHSLVLNSTDRHRYLLFHVETHRVLVRLKPGTQTRQVIKEVKQQIANQPAV